MADKSIPAGALVSSALRAVGEGLSGNAWQRALTAAGSGIRRDVAQRIYRQAQTLAAEYGQEPTRPLDRAPTLSEARQWPTQNSSGVLQTVRLFYREAVTGRVIDRFYNIKTEGGISRQEAINKAIDANTANATRYQQTLIGAFHTGTAILVPSEAA